MARGGKREGAGRKTKAEELGLPKLIDEVIGEDGKRKLIQAIHTKAKAGSFKHQELLMHYCFGKPTERYEIDSENYSEITITWTKPDELPTVIDQSNPPDKAGS